MKLTVVCVFTILFPLCALESLFFEARLTHLFFPQRKNLTWQRVYCSHFPPKDKVDAGSDDTTRLFTTFPAANGHHVDG